MLPSARAEQRDPGGPRTGDPGPAAPPARPRVGEPAPGLPDSGVVVAGLRRTELRREPTRRPGLSAASPACRPRGRGAGRVDGRRLAASAAISARSSGGSRTSTAPPSARRRPATSRGQSSVSRSVRHAGSGSAISVPFASVGRVDHILQPARGAPPGPQRDLDPGRVALVGRRRLGPVRGQVEALGPRRPFLGRLDVQDARHAVRAELAVVGGDEVPVARLEHDPERVDDPPDRAVAAVVLGLDPEALPDRLRDRREPRAPCRRPGTSRPRRGGSARGGG